MRGVTAIERAIEALTRMALAEAIRVVPDPGVDLRSKGRLDGLIAALVCVKRIARGKPKR